MSTEREGGQVLPFGEAFRRRRLALRLKQEALADTIGVAQNTISNWERAVSAPRDLYALQLAANTLGTSLEDLIEGWIPDVLPSAVPLMRGEQQAAFDPSSHVEAGEGIADLITEMAARTNKDPVQVARLLRVFFSASPERREKMIEAFSKLVEAEAAMREVLEEAGSDVDWDSLENRLRGRDNDHERFILRPSEGKRHA